MSKRYLNREESAEYCGLGFSTLNNMAYQGKGPAYIKINGRVVYDINDLDEWLQSLKVRPEQKAVAVTLAPVRSGHRGRPRKLVEAMA
jgi:predicted DNA-binding transcriptional regulator AlpA